MPAPPPIRDPPTVRLGTSSGSGGGSSGSPLSIRLTENISFLRGSATGEDSRGRALLPSQVTADQPPTMLRGLLTMRLNKGSRIRKIEIRLEGRGRTEWPEGIGPRRTETAEDKVIISESIVFFSAQRGSSQSSLSRTRSGLSSGGSLSRRARGGAVMYGGVQDRRTMSVGPGSYMDREGDGIDMASAVDLDEDDEFSSGGEADGDGEEEGEDDDGRGRSGFARVSGGAAGPSSRLGPGAPRNGPGGMRSMSAFASGSGGRMPPGPQASGFISTPNAQPYSSSVAATASGSSSAAVAPQLNGLAMDRYAGLSADSGYRGRGSPTSHQNLEVARGTLNMERERGPSPAYSPRDPMRSSSGHGSSSLSNGNGTGSLNGAGRSTGGGPLPSAIRPRAESFRLDPLSSPRALSPGPSSTEDIGYARDSILAPIISEPPSSASSQENLSRFRQGSNRPLTNTMPSEADIGAMHMDDLSITEGGTPSIAEERDGRSSGEHTSDSERRHRLSVSNGGARRESSSGVPSASSGSDNPSREAPGIPSRGRAHVHIPTNSLDFMDVSRPGSRQSSIIERIPSPSPTPAGSIHEGSEGNHQHRGSISNLMHRSNLGPGRKPSATHLPGLNDHNNAPMEPQRSASTSSAATQMRDTSRAGSTEPTGRKPSVSGTKPSFFSSLRGFSRSRSKAPSEASTVNSARARMLSPDANDFGHLPGRSASRGRGRAESPAGTRESRSGSAGGSRGRMPGVKGFGAFAIDEDKEGAHNWKEFKKGTYNYPISFTLPASLPPTIHADFGSIIYRLKATVTRVGALTPNFAEEKEVILLASPAEDDTEETENIIVERQWEEQMRYVIALSGKQFPIGGQLPMSVRIVPMSKCALFRLSATIEEKIDYFAMDKKVARHEAVKKYPLLALKGPEKPTVQPLLPIISSSPDAFKDSPLAPYAYLAVEGNETPDDAAASLLNPVGPWHVEMNLQVPDCVSRLRFTTKHAKDQITVSHWLKVVMRMERGDLVAIDAKGKKKQFDIIIETPLHLLDCRVNNLWNSLPTYAARRALETASQATGVICRVHGIGGPPGAVGSSGSSAAKPVIPRASPSRETSRPGASLVTSSTGPTPPIRSASEIQEVEGEDSLLERNIVFDRLISGQESELGEAPPTYEDALKRRSRSRSHAAARSQSRLNVRDGSRLRRTDSPGSGLR